MKIIYPFFISTYAMIVPSFIVGLGMLILIGGIIVLFTKKSFEQN